MTPCPTCQKPVDPLRARAVSIRSGKIVAYCSSECEALAVAADAREIASDEAAIRARTGPRPATSGRVPASIEDVDSGPVIEILHEPASGVVTSAADQRHRPGPRDDHPAPAVAVAGPIAGQRSSEGKDSASLAGELNRGDKRMTTVQRRRDSVEARAAWEWLDDEPAEHARRGTGSEQPRRKGRAVLVVVLAVVVLAAGGVLAYRYLASARTTPPPEPRPTVVVPPVPDAAPPAPSLDDRKRAALERAREVLRAYLASESPRVQLMAAAALSRTGDPASLGLLATALATQKDNASQRLAYAYQLARADDKRGTDALAAALGSARRDDRLDAAKRLAQLGDPRAVPVLTSYLDVSQHRLSVLEVLARYPDPTTAVEKGLRQIRVDARTSVDEKARATIALGVGGHAEVVPELRALLADKGHNPQAAAALAALHDDAARPILADQLATMGLRVDAARMLRTLDPALDPTPLLPRLFDDLERLKDKDTEQIPVAEAILLLAGPASWSERM